MATSIGILTLTVLLTACGQVVVDGTALDGSAQSGSTSGAGGAAPCAPPPAPSPTLPTEPGCYTNMGSGWIQIPCGCELWLKAATPAPSQAGIHLLMTPPEEVPTFTGPLQVEVDFADPDASWYAIWSKQPGVGQAFAVATAEGKTVVRMGQSEITLAPVPLAGCELRKAFAHVIGSYTATLELHAVLDDGGALATADASCSNPPPTPPQ